MDSNQNGPSPLRERLRREGAATLSFRELLAVIVGGADADATARSLAAVEGGDESAIADAMLAHVGSSPTLDAEKVALVLASVELGRRLASRADVDRPVIRGPIDVVRLLLPSMEDLPDEEYRAVCLDAQRSVLPDLNTRQIARDLLASPSTARREEDGGGIPNHTAAIILVHNRPSGDPTPSVDDRALTDRLLDACRLLNLMVFDHVILGRGRYYSFAEAGLL